MRVRFLVLGALLIFSAGVWINPSYAQEPIVGRADRFGVSPPLHSIKVAQPKTDRSELHEVPIHHLPKAEKAGDKIGSLDTGLQPLLPAPNMPVPTNSFEGISNTDNITVNGFAVLPPDTNGDVGPNHYVQTVNLLFKVFSKTGASLLGPLPISALFSGFGGPCETTDDGDPIVLYDHLADRWLISQFAVVGPPSHQCIAISQTGDPTGAYFLYDFAMPNSKFNDYPKFGVWPDGYYMTDNQFDFVTEAFLGAGVFAFDRAKMLVGDPTASFIYFDLATVDPGIGGVLPSDLDGPAPMAGTPNYFSFFTANEFGDPQDALRVFEFRADFSTPVNSTFTERPESPIVTAAFDPTFSCGASGRDCIPQPAPAGANSNLDAISDRLMHRLQYRNFDTHESLVVNHTVDADGTNHAGVRYYEVRRTLPGGAFLINEQATFAPDADHRWMGSAAMDKQGNLAVGYSVSSETTFPSIRYAGRLATDPPGGLFQGEAELQAGGGSQTSISSRWGDYSMLAVDPLDDCTFWYTSNYYSVSSNAGWQTRIGSFKFPSCTALPEVTISATDASATETGQTTGTFTVSRTGSAGSALTVNYTVSGTATSVSDYAALSGSVTIPMGFSTATITVTPVDDALVESSETVIVTLSPNAAYTVGTLSSATVTIIDNDSSGEIIIDNSTAGTSFTGSWCVSSAGGFFGTNSLYSCGSGLDTYRWTPTIPSTAIYDVYVWWTAEVHQSTNVPITVVHAGGSTTLNFNQQIGGGQWVLHGRYTFNAGTGGYVQTSDVNGRAAADAVRWVPVSTLPTVTISATDATATETGQTTGTFTVSRTGSTSSALTVNYTVSGTATSGGDYVALAGSITIPSASATATITVTPVDDSLVEGDETVTATLSANAAYTVGTPSNATVTITDNDTVSAEIIIDNGTAGTSFTGSWCVSSASNFFGTNSLFSCGSGLDTYRWTPTIPSTAIYDVYVWWTAEVHQSTNVPITVVHAGGTTTRNFNEQVGGGQWVLHGTYTFNSGTGGYVETSDVNGQAAADAVRWVPVP